MKTYKTQKEVEADIVDGRLMINDNVTFECPINIQASISARDISARDISARDISAWNISAWNITAWNISAWNISALDISARDISFYAVCFAYSKFVCKTIKGWRAKSKYFCLDSDVVVEGKQ